MSHFAITHSPPHMRCKFLQIALFTFCVLIMVASPAQAQVQTAPNDDAPELTIMQKGVQHINQQKWVEAIELFESLTRSQPQNGLAWMRLGYARHANGDLGQALPAHIMAAEFPNSASTGAYNAACVYSLFGNKDKAFVWLQKAIAKGFNNASLLKTDPDLNNIREDARFEQYAAKIQAAPADNTPGQVVFVPDDDSSETETSATQPETYSSGKPDTDWTSLPVRRQFDFWIGKWDAINATGKKVGTNVITKREGGFIIHESWTSANGSTGQSINYFDPADQKWKQVWVSQNGGVVYYSGSFKDGAMRYTGDNIKADGTKVHAECTLTPLEDGRIHHFIRHTTDGGKTWTTYFDAHYVPRKK